MYGDSKRDSRPFFRTNVTLAIPNIVMQPALDEVQQGLSKAVQHVLSVCKGIAQWSKERKQPAKVNSCRDSSIKYYKTANYRNFTFVKDRKLSVQVILCSVASYYKVLSLIS